MPVIGRGGSNPPSDTPVWWPHRTPCDSPTPRTTQQVDTRTEPLDSAPLAAVTIHHQQQSGQGCGDTSDPVSAKAGRAAIGEPVAPPITKHMTPVPAADHRAPVPTSATAAPVSSESATTPITAPMTTFTPPSQQCSEPGIHWCMTCRSRLTKDIQILRSHAAWWTPREAASVDRRLRSPDHRRPRTRLWTWLWRGSSGRGPRHESDLLVVDIELRVARVTGFCVLCPSGT